MNVAGPFRWVMLGLVGMAMVMYFTASGDVLLASASLPLLLVGWFLSEGRVRAWLPEWLVNVLLLAAIAYSVNAALRSGIDIQGICRFIILVTLVKVFEHKRARDHAQLIALSVFLMIGAIMTSNTLLFAMTLLVVLPVLVAALMLFQIAVGQERLALAQGGTVRDVPAGSGAWRRLGALGALTTVGVTVLAVGVFVLAPRGLGRDTLGTWANARLGQGRITGFSDEIRLGVGGLISESPAVVMDLEVRDRAGNNLGSPSRIIYLRGAVLDHYENGKWVGSGDDAPGPSPLSITPGVPVLVGPPDPTRGRGTYTHEQIVTLRNAPDGWTYLFSEWRPSQVTFGEPGVLRTRAQTGVLERRGPGGRIRYTVRSVLSHPGDGPGAIDPPESPGLPGVERLARRILTDAGMDPDRVGSTPALRSGAARALAEYLQSNYTYTLDILTAPRRRDPTQWFLLDRKEGHCEYFASGLAAMSRSVGVDARVVTGFVAGEFNEASRRYVIRERNAHAWTEIQTSPGVWERVDATPPADFARIHRPRTNLARRARQWFDAIDYAWITSVVAYDADRQTRLLAAAGLDTGALAARSEGLLEGVRSGGLPLLVAAFRNGLVAFALIGVLGFGGSAMLGFVWPLVRRRWGWRRRADDPAAGYYARMLRTLRRMGLGKPAWRPPLAHAAAIASQAPDAARLVERISRAYYSVRFGGKEIDDDRRRELDAMVRELGQVGRRS